MKKIALNEKGVNALMNDLVSTHIVLNALTEFIDKHNLLEKSKGYVEEFLSNVSEEEFYSVGENIIDVLGLGEDTCNGEQAEA